MNRRILLLCFFLSCMFGCLAEPLYWFNYSIDKGGTAIFSIFRDSRGGTWLGTNGGYYFFTGYESYPCHIGGKMLQVQSYDTVELGGILYLGTNDGLYAIDPEKLEGRLLCDTPREIRSMTSYQGELWLGSLTGLYRYNVADGSVAGPVDGLPHHAVYSVLDASDGTLYVGTYNGLCRYRPVDGTFESIILPPAREGGNTFVNVVAEHPQTGLLYIGTEGSLLVYNPKTGHVGHLDACNGLSVKSICFLNHNTIVAGTDHGLVLIPSEGPSTVYRHDSRQPNTIVSNTIWSLFSDSLGNIWAGTDMGLSIANPDSPVKIYSIADMTGRGDGQQVFNILRDSYGDLWIGGTNGIIRFPEDGSTAGWFVPGNGRRSLSHNRVRHIMEDSRHMLWLATDGGVNVYDRRNDRFVNHRISDRSNNMLANWVYGMLEEPADSTVWVASYLGGVFVEDRDRFLKEGATHVADTVLSVATGLPNEYIGSMVRDRDGNKWIMNFHDSGLTRVDWRTKSVRRFTLDGPGGGEAQVLCCDADGRVWCGFYGGLVCYSPEGDRVGPVVRFPLGAGDETVRAMAPVGRSLWVATADAVWAVNVDDFSISILPLPDKSYSAIFYDTRRGVVILGAVDEIVVADPARLMVEHSDEDLGIFKIYNDGESVDFTVEGPAVCASLPSDNRNIRIALSTRYFTPGRYLRFCYRIGASDTWHLLDYGDNTVAVTSLPPGKAMVEVALAGMPEKAVVLTLDVAQPWYRSILAFIVYFLVLAVALAGIIIEVRRRHRVKIEEMKRRNVLATVENRLFFLSNISHELKTPLSMILGPLSKLRTAALPEEQGKDVALAYQNALKLNSLIHQTLEMNRLDLAVDNMLIYSKIDVVEFCRNIFENYRRENTGREFVFTSTRDHIYARTDAVKLESLLNNLLSNAVKYSGNDSTVTCSVSEEGSDFIIGVSDDGVGIPFAEQSLVFQRMYRSPRTASTHEGTGIGLYLVRQFAELLGGSVTLISHEGVGSTFTLRLPMGEDSQEAGKTESEMPSPDGSGRKRVLIVDDNRSIAAFISSVLSDTYNCAEAYNGKAGLSVAAAFKPDIVIVDEMMPVMSGMEMIRRMRENQALFHVPILLLTAKDTPGIQGESISSGADAFMAKPFEAPTLKAKVAQLLHVTDKIRKSLRLDHMTTPEIEHEESAGEKQLAAVTDIIEKNLSNPDMNVEFVSKASGIPGKTLYRLIKKYVGVSPLDYIRQTRLRKAAVLLEQGKFSVSEVMYMVGFNSSSYFSKCFTAQFGISPGRYSSRSREENS